MTTGIAVLAEIGIIVTIETMTITEISNYEEERTDYKSQPPNNTIMVRGLAQHITENDIRADILACNLMPKDIRLVRKKESVLYSCYASGPCDLEEAIESRFCLSQRDGHNVAG
ncbi:hypothetical protein E2C01_042304 [Portunus trituberculatus]|uniref:Uncharacterized protein n=1 Tax=Portunus trituberculatus TaxID=210409 RepID=A0A5B7FLG5_PORTR|nr:hypothetical protein [Portunus trituberculatus]